MEWLTILVPVLVTAVGATVLDTSVPRAPSPVVAPGDVCRDRAGLVTFVEIVAATKPPSQSATPETIVATYEHRIRVTTRVIHVLERYEPYSSWGAAMKTRLIAGLERIVSADRALLRHEITRRRHEREYDEVNRAAADLAAATC